MLEPSVLWNTVWEPLIYTNSSTYKTKRPPTDFRLDILHFFFNKRDVCLKFAKKIMYRVLFIWFPNFLYVNIQFFWQTFFFIKLHVLKQILLIPEQLPNYIDISIKKIGTFSVTDDNKRCFVLHLLSKKLLIESESKSHSESPIDKSNYRTWINFLRVYLRALFCYQNLFLQITKTFAVSNFSFLKPLIPFFVFQYNFR